MPVTCSLQEVTQNKEKSQQEPGLTCAHLLEVVIVGPLSRRHDHGALIDERGPWKCRITPCVITHSSVSCVGNLGHESVSFYKMMRCAKRLQRPRRDKNEAAGCQPLVLLGYPLWIQDKGNYFCPAVPDYCPGGREIPGNGSDRMRKGEKVKRHLSQTLAASTNKSLDEGEGPDSVTWLEFFPFNSIRKNIRATKIFWGGQILE